MLKSGTRTTNVASVPHRQWLDKNRLLARLPAWTRRTCDRPPQRTRSIIGTQISDKPDEA